jgi:hypothetical protein
MYINTRIPTKINTPYIIKLFIIAVFNLPDIVN